ncbi:MAG: hypothetical protein HYZ28_21385 [Myxococcales bacterium]|nr:hypothetical protein [Myxococcales bacterium]
MTRRRSGKRPVTGGMRVRAYEVLSRAVDEGVAYGWRRAHKHTDAPGEDAIKDQVTQAVLSEVCEYFDFADESDPAP